MLGASGRLAFRPGRASAVVVSRPARVPAQEPGYPFTRYDGRLVFVRVFFEANSPPRGPFYTREPPWHHDYPYAETGLMSILGDATYTRVVRGGNVLRASDPELNRFPVAWLAEPGYWTPDEKDVANLRAYLLKGGFLIFDDFSSPDLPNLLEQMRRIVPELRPMELDGSEPIFHTFFDIRPDELDVHSYRSRREPERYLGYFEGNDRSRRQLAILDVNNDIGEFMEYSDRGFSPVSTTNEAFKLGMNYMIYALTH